MTKGETIIVGIFEDLRAALQAVDELKEARLSRSVRLHENEGDVSTERRIERVVIEGCQDEAKATEILRAYGATLEGEEPTSGLPKEERDKLLNKGEELLKHEMGRMAQQLDREVATNKVPFEHPNRDLGL